MPNKYRSGKAKEHFDNTFEVTNPVIDTTNFEWVPEPEETDNKNISQEEKPIDAERETLQEEKGMEAEKVVVDTNENYINQLDVENELGKLDEMQRGHQALKDAAKALSDTIANKFAEIGQTKSEEVKQDKNENVRETAYNSDEELRRDVREANSVQSKDENDVSMEVPALEIDENEEQQSRGIEDIDIKETEVEREADIEQSTYGDIIDEYATNIGMDNGEQQSRGIDDIDKDMEVNADTTRAIDEEATKNKDNSFGNGNNKWYRKCDKEQIKVDRQIEALTIAKQFIKEHKEDLGGAKSVNVVWDGGKYVVQVITEGKNAKTWDVSGKDDYKFENEHQEKKIPMKKPLKVEAGKPLEDKLEQLTNYSAGLGKVKEDLRPITTVRKMLIFKRPRVIDEEGNQKTLKEANYKDIFKEAKREANAINSMFKIRRESNMREISEKTPDRDNSNTNQISSTQGVKSRSNSSNDLSDTKVKRKTLRLQKDANKDLEQNNTVNDKSPTEKAELWKKISKEIDKEKARNNEANKGNEFLKSNFKNLKLEDINTMAEDRKNNNNRGIEP